MKQVIKRAVAWLARRYDYELVPHRARIDKSRVDFEEDHLRILRLVNAYTMTSVERIYALIEAVKYVARNRIPGAIVECGVWKGGSMMAAAHTLLSLNCPDKDLYLFDTFEGMPKPSELDVDFSGGKATEKFEKVRISETSSQWANASLEAVQEAMYGTKYPKELIHFVKGMVEETIPRQAPQTLSVLRLDTDWYESTRHELLHLFPRLSPGGILILDDYGHYRGARKAVDEYVAQNNLRLFLARVDFSGRVAVKL